MKSVSYFYLLLLYGLRVSSTIIVNTNHFQGQSSEFQSSADTEEVQASSLISCSSICLSKSNCHGYEPPSGGTCKLHFSPVTLISNPVSLVYVKKQVTTPDPTIPEPTTPEPTTPELTTPEPTTPEPTTPEHTTLEPTTPEPTTSEPTTPEPTTPEPTTPEPTTPEPTTPELTKPVPTRPELTTLEPTTPELTTQEPTTPASTTPEPTTPEPTTAEPTTPEPTTPEPTTPEPTTPELTTPVPTTPELITLEPTTPELTTLEPTTTEATTPEPTTTVITTTAQPPEGFVEYTSGRWVKIQPSVSQITWHEALVDCPGTDNRPALFFVPKSVADVNYMITLRRDLGISDGDRYWIGLSDEHDETQYGIGSWEWVDGTVVNDTFGMILYDNDGRDTEENDYATFSIESDSVALIKFYSVSQERDGYICEMYI